LNANSNGRVVRKRRSWYRRRLRIQRTLIATSMLLLLAAVCWRSAARHFGLPAVHPSQILPDSFWARGDIRNKLSLMAVRTVARHASSQSRGTYPYSVIPGGVRDAADLREIAARDYVVARHFARFEYIRARLVRAREAREVYLSYRLRDRIFWTRKKVHLRPGELLITDGKITARTRCGNQVSENPKPEVSDEEPDEEVLDQPVAEIEPIGPSLPFRSALARPSLPGAEPQPPRSPQHFAGGFHFPYVPFGVPPPSGLCETAAQEQWELGHGIVDDEKKEKHCRPRHKHPVVPEPATVLLISSGLVGIYWRYRRAGRAPAA
jgi:PEP-CTERM motif